MVFCPAIFLKPYFSASCFCVFPPRQEIKSPSDKEKVHVCWRIIKNILTEDHKPWSLTACSVNPKYSARHTSAVFIHSVCCDPTLSMWTPKKKWHLFHASVRFVCCCFFFQSLTSLRQLLGGQRASSSTFNPFLLMDVQRITVFVVSTSRSESVHLKIQLTDMYSTTIVNNGAEVYTNVCKLFETWM